MQNSTRTGRPRFPAFARDDRRAAGKERLVRRAIRSWWMMAALAAAALAPAGAKAGIIVAGTEQAHLDFASDPMFQSVGWFAGYRPGESVKTAGSGVLIAPDWVLTAAHVLDNGWSNVSFSLDLQARVSGNLVSADAWYMYPGFVADNGAGGTNDIALVHLSTPILGVTPADIYWGEVTPGTHAYWAGYGRLGYYPSGEIPPSGTKRGGENVVDMVGDPSVGVRTQFFISDFGPAWHTPSTPLEMGGANFDSGGGWFADYDGQMQLIGIGTFIRGDFTNTGAIRPAVYRDWIESYVPLSNVPEPTSALLLLTTMPFVLHRRRAKRCS